MTPFETVEYLLKQKYMQESKMRDAEDTVKKPVSKTYWKWNGKEVFSPRWKHFISKGFIMSVLQLG